MISFREEFVNGLPKLPAGKQSEVHCVINQSSASDPRIPQRMVSFESIGEEQLSCQGFQLGFLRPLPAFIEISTEEFNWVSPGIVPDLQWDNSGEMEKKLAKTKGLMKKASETALSLNQFSEVVKILETQPYAVLNMDVHLNSFPEMMKINPALAGRFLIHLSSYPLVAEYLDVILHTPMGRHSIDVVTHLIQKVKLPFEFLVPFSLKILRQTQALSQTNNTRLALARLTCAFMMTLFRLKIVPPSLPLREQIKKFTKSFIQIEDSSRLIAQLYQPNP